MPVSYGGQSQQRWGDNTLNANEYMRDLFLADLKGIMQGTMPARKKGMLVLAFFRTDDPVSQRVLPLLQKMADAYKESGKLSLLAVSQSDPESTAAFVSQYEIKFPVALDRDNYHSMLYGIGAVPVVYLTDANGLVLTKTKGYKPLVLNDISARYAAFAEVEAVTLVDEVPTTSAAALFSDESPTLMLAPEGSGESPTLVTRGGESPTLINRGDESPTLVTRPNTTEGEPPTAVTKRN